jgi:hypothetical protein
LDVRVGKPADVRFGARPKAGDLIDCGFGRMYAATSLCIVRPTEGWLPMNRREVSAFVLAVMLAGGFADGTESAEGAPENSDGLVRQRSKRLKYVYLLPGANFSGYDTILLDPTHVAFAGQITDGDIAEAAARASKAATEIFAKAFEAGGYTIANALGQGVLRVSTSVVNIRVTSPDMQTTGITVSGGAGSATFVVEARDSVSNALLGRATDDETAGVTSIAMRRTATTNRADFRDLAKTWAKDCVKGLNELKALSPGSR